MKLINILQLPAYYKDRYKNINAVNILDFKIDKDFENGSITCSANTGKYNIKIMFSGDKITTDMDIRVDCECKSFAFEFSKSIRDAGGLIYEDKYPDLVGKKNKYHLICGCKHLIQFGKFIYQRRIIIEQEIRRINAR
jgi:hypothetical protein